MQNIKNLYMKYIYWPFRKYIYWPIYDAINAYIPAILAILCAAVGIFAWSKEILWLLIVCGVAAFILRTIGSFRMIPEIDGELEWIKKSSIVLLIVSACGCLLLLLWYKTTFDVTFFLSLNAAIIIFTVLDIAANSYIRLSFRTALIDSVAQQAGLPRKQLKHVKIKEIYDSEKNHSYYKVTFSHGDNQYSYKVSE